MSDRAEHGVGSFEGEGSARMESDKYDFQEDETEHDHHAEADVDNGDAVELEDSLDGAGGMSDNYAEDEFYAVDSVESIGWIDFLNLSEEDVFRFNFTDVDIAFEFYQQYAKHHGFGARRSRSEKRGEVRIRQEFVCHRQGYRSPKFYSMPNGQKRPRAETRCGCPARMLLRMDDESGRWLVAYFSDAHNHHVLELRLSSMLPGHRRMSEADIEQMNDMRKGGIGVSRIHGFMASLAGGYHNVLYTTRDMHNVNAKQLREGGLDAESCLRYLRECKTNDPALYYKEVVDGEGVLQHLFWCDGTSQIDYQVFGDVVTFDATYKKNVYLSPLVVFSGVNHHNQTVVFAAALVADEKEETYVWLLQQLQTLMKGKAPVSIITDGDRQMKSVIKQVFSEAHHRLCAWHLLRNATSNIGKPKFTRMFRDCMLGDYEVRTFERKWFEMVEKFGVADKRWVQDMYERRHSWATAHIRRKFFAGFRTTSSYTEFLRHFQRCLMFVRAKEVEADFECAKGDPVMTTNLKQLERSAAENYTRAIFYLFVPILDRACAMRVVDSEDNGSYFIHIVSRYGTPGKDWRVVATFNTREVRCTCMRMECFGVPCEHIVAVLVLNNVHEISRSLILPRWTKDAKLVAVQSIGVIWDSVQLTQHWCLMDWYRKVCKIACHSIEKFQFARDTAMLMLKHFENEDTGDTSFPPEGPPTEGGRGPTRNPPRRNTKGNGAHGGKKIQRCRLYREVGHNRTTCPGRRTMESSSAVADDMDSMDTDMLYDNLSGDLYATAEIPSFQCSDSDTQAGFANSDFAGTNTSGPVMSLAD
ncbi:protein FAR1-RELATED SEQUENCE 5-like [Arachis hypogaea]|uniref:protein FAR1-RELATED SEQUENCE 5-like n=1 Tax=Arachis hypogaea TaxID=3818 RepID=UPI000DEDFC47|nr:protein FAR1-RELATED SEQUENCE 5-like [Arachis hypogaea]